MSIDVDKRLTAKDKAVLEAGTKEFKLAFEQRGDSIIAYIAEPFDWRPNWDAGRHNNGRNRDDRRIVYDFTLDFTVKIPRQMNVVVSTVNRGT